jgi:hypothetical protein
VFGRARVLTLRMDSPGRVIFNTALNTEILTLPLTLPPRRVLSSTFGVPSSMLGVLSSMLEALSPIVEPLTPMFRVQSPTFGPPSSDVSDL